jgi:hypothetical protein
MSNPTNRLKCLELAAKVINARQPLPERMEKFCAFVQDDALRLGCLRLAMDTVGRQPRIASDGVIRAAEEYLTMVLGQPPPAPPAPPAPTPEPQTRRGRRGRKS